MMAGGGFFDIEVTGRARHGGAMPHRASTRGGGLPHRLALQSIVSRNVSPTDTAVVVGDPHPGRGRYNVIPQTAQLSGTVRAFSRTVMDLIGARLPQIAAGWRTPTAHKPSRRSASSSPRR